MTSGSYLRSASLRIALMYGLWFITGVVIILGFIYLTTVGYMDRQLDNVLLSESQGLQRVYEKEGQASLISSINDDVGQHPDGEVVYLLIDQQDQPLAGNLEEWPTSAIDDEGWADFLLDEWDYEKETRPARAMTVRLASDLRLLVGRDVSGREHVHGLVREALIWAFAITVCLALGIGVLISRRVTGRLEKINQAASQIMKGELSERIPRDDSNDDFDQVAVNLNEMLDRIQSLMVTIQEISGNVAHDLRRPLTHLIHHLEEASSAEPRAAEKALEQAKSDAEQLMSTFDALLRITRIESGGRRSEFEPVDLSVVLKDVGELYEPVASDGNKHLNVETESALTVMGDRNLLFQAVANLVDNAIKFTPSGGQICLGAQADGAQINLVVSDSGPGIPADKREKVFQRFYRADESRSTPGNGLGLNLVQAIADLHHADLELSDNSPGLRVRFSLKRH